MIANGALTRWRAGPTPAILAAVRRNPLAFLFASSRREQYLAHYVIREHARGRSLEDILDDPYVTNRCTPEQVRRVLERPEVVRALGDDIAAAQLSDL